MSKRRFRSLGPAVACCLLIIAGACAHEPHRPANWPVIKQLTGQNSDLLQAAMWGDLETLKSLLNQGAEAETQSKGLKMTPLMYAAWRGDLAMTRVLIDHGADPDAQNFFGYTPLMWAAENGHREVVERLLEAGADPEIKNIDNHQAQTLACRREHKEIAGLIQDLQESP